MAHASGVCEQRDGGTEGWARGAGRTPPTLGIRARGVIEQREGGSGENDRRHKEKRSDTNLTSFKIN